MAQAFAAAHKAAADHETPIGAVIVCQGAIIATAHNLTESGNDATAHAEMLALRAASQTLGTRYLTECDLYVTLEPCPMCAAAISLARIRRLYFGAYDPKGGGVEHGPRIFEHATCHHRPEIIGGLMEQECGQLLKDFFAKMR